MEHELHSLYFFLTDLANYGSRMAAPNFTLTLLHEAARDSLYALVRLHDFMLRNGPNFFVQSDNPRFATFFREYIAPFCHASEKLTGLTDLSLESMTIARPALGRDIVWFRGISSANVHTLVLGVAIFFMRLWNRWARPEAIDIPPATPSATFQFVLYSPREAMDFDAFLNEAYQCLSDFNPLSLQAELDTEYVKAKEIFQTKQNTLEQCIQRQGHVWHLRYQNESAEYPVRGNLPIGWLLELLAKPNRALSVAALRGDPDGKLAADSTLGTENATDRQGLLNIKNRIQEIDLITKETGGSEMLENEKAKLLEYLRNKNPNMLGSQLRRAHSTVAAQLRTLIGKKLKKDMPQLAAHLKATVKLDFPNFGYYPPVSSPNWHF